MQLIMIISDYYSDSVPRALQMVYPEHEWLFWMFANVPRGWWSNIKNQREFVSWLENQLGVETPGNLNLGEISLTFH